MYEARSAGEKSTAAFAATWGKVVEIVMDEVDAFRVLMEGSRQGGRKTLTMDKQVAYSSANFASTVTLVHVVGHPTTSVREWLLDPSHKKATVKLRTGSMFEAVASASEVESNSIYSVRIAGKSYSAPIRRSRRIYTIGPIAFPGQVVDQPSGVITEIVLENIEPPESGLDLVVVGIGEYLAGRELLIATWREDLAP